MAKRYFLDLSELVPHYFTASKSGRWVKYIDHHREISSLRAELDAAKARLEDAVSIIDALCDNDECRYDHHGYCQTHRLEEDCSVARGRALLSRLAAEKKE